VLRPSFDQQHYEQMAGLAGWNLNLTAYLAGHYFPYLVDRSTKVWQILLSAAPHTSPDTCC
jgi:hypothetical protein